MNEQVENLDTMATEAAEAPTYEADDALNIEEEAVEVISPEEAQARDRVATLEKERDEFLSLAQRVQADFDNYRRRNNAVRSEAFEDGCREMMAQMLPVIDNLERAIDAAGPNNALREGVELVLKQMLELLQKRGVTEIDCLGKPFDPEEANAVLQGDASEGEPGTVCMVLQKGYRDSKRVLRHAMVKVVANP